MPSYGRVVVEADKGVHITDVSGYVLEVAKKLNVTVYLHFNGMEFLVKPTDTTARVHDRFQLARTWASL